MRACACAHTVLTRLHVGLPKEQHGDLRGALLVLIQHGCVFMRVTIPEGTPGAASLAAQTLYHLDVPGVLAQLR